MIFLQSGSEMKALELVVMSILWCNLIPVMTSPSLPVSHYTTPTTSSQHWHGLGPTFTCTVCSLSPSCSLLGILLTEGRLPPNLSLICCRDRVILGLCMVVCILTLSTDTHSSDLNFFTTHELCRARKNIAASRIGRIFIWKSWKILIPWLPQLYLWVY